MRDRASPSPLDHAIGAFDRALRTLAVTPSPETPTPQPSEPKADATKSDLTAQDQSHATGLMRVNHTGEVCAQALYDGQAFLARDPKVKAQLQHAAAEESDHLAWCAQRLEQLDGRPSVLNPLFYAGSFAMGAAAALLGDRISLGFVEATEAQVVQHLDEHLASLPADDHASRAILEQMREDETRHGHQALAAGGEAFPAPVKAGMSMIAKLMTFSTYRI